LRSFRLGIPGTLVAATTLIGGAISILSIAVRLHPALESVKHLKESVDLYGQYIRKPLTQALSRGTGFEVAGFAAGTAMDLLVFWVMFFIAVNVFVYKHERNFLPGHISRSYCQLTPCNIFSRAACVTPKLIVAFFAAPIVCAVHALTKFRAPRWQLYSAAYLTIQPRTIFSYLLALFGGVTLILLASTYALKTWG
jgi:hypothetical protein